MSEFRHALVQSHLPFEVLDLDLLVDRDDLFLDVAAVLFFFLFFVPCYKALIYRLVERNYRLLLTVGGGEGFFSTVEAAS